MVVLKLDDVTYKKILNDYLKYEVKSKEDYVIHYFKLDNLSIKIYENNKSEKTALFLKKDSLKAALKYDKNAKEVQINPKEKSYYKNINTQIGSDEVGVGDALLPLIVVASYIKSEDLDLLKYFKIDDSKKMSDSYILSIGPQLIRSFKFVKYTIDNYKFNNLLKMGYNNNSIKAKYHNLAIYLLEEKYHTSNCYIDEFVNKEKYFSYLKNEKYIFKNLNFSINGERYYPSVALSSVIARYYLLLYKQKLEEQYQMEFVFGANKKVDEFINRFLKKYPKEELYKIAKANFKNIKTYLSDDNTLIK